MSMSVLHNDLYSQLVVCLLGLICEHVLLLLQPIQCAFVATQYNYLALKSLTELWAAASVSFLISCISRSQKLAFGADMIISTRSVVSTMNRTQFWQLNPRFIHETKVRWIFLVNNILKDFFVALYLVMFLQLLVWVNYRNLFFRVFIYVFVFKDNLFFTWSIC